MHVIDEKGMPDLLISDVMMPGSMDGQEFAAKLRARQPDLPVLLISGYAETVDPEYAFLRKPFSMSQLEAAIDGLFSGAS